MTSLLPLLLFFPHDSLLVHRHLLPFFFHPITSIMLPFFLLLILHPLLIFSYHNAILYIPREEASYRFKVGERLENEDRITISTGWQRHPSPINATFYFGCDIPLLLHFVPEAGWIHLWQRVNGKYKRRHTIQNFRPNSVVDNLDLHLRYMDGVVNIHINDAREDFPPTYQYRWEVPMDDLTKIVVHGSGSTGTNIIVDHKGKAMQELAKNTKMKGPNF